MSLHKQKHCPNTDIAKESKRKKCFLHNFDLCTEMGDYNASIDPKSLEKKLGVDHKSSGRSNINEVLCHIHYNTLSNLKPEISRHVE